MGLGMGFSRGFGGGGLKGLIAELYSAATFDNSLDASDMKDPLAPASSAQERVAWMEENAEDRGGDGPAMIESLSQDIIDSIQAGYDNGEIEANEKIIIDIALRDPDEGETIVLARTSATINEENGIMIENSHPAYILDEERRMIGHSTPEHLYTENRRSAEKIFNSIKDKLQPNHHEEEKSYPDKSFECITGDVVDHCVEGETHTFLADNEENQTQEINLTVPSPFNRNP